MTYRLLLLLCLMFLASGSAVGQEAITEPDVAADSVLAGEPEDTIPPPAPPMNLQAMDTDNDNGHSITLTWEKSADDQAGDNTVLGYEIFMFKPYLADTLDMIRSRLSWLEQLDVKVSRDLEAYEMATQEIVDSFVVKIDSFAARTALDPTDSAAIDSVRLLQVQLDSLEALLARVQADPDFPDREADSLRDLYLRLMDRLPAAYEQYPENGEMRTWEGAVAPSGATRFRHAGTKDEWSDKYLPSNTDLYYRLDAVTADTDARASTPIVGPVQAQGEWFNDGRLPVLVAVLVFGFLIFYFVNRARAGADLYVRPLAGIEAVDDAIGRATEMGRPILYVLGLGTAADVATIASFTILSRVAKQVAEYQTALNVPTYDPIVMTVAQEVVKSAYLDAGRPDDYQEETVHFVTQSQFAYVAAVNGIMLRERPATNIYMGKFFAESLILAETGALAGSIQISGTDEIAQIPFFIVACDYTLIGEELYAASAYLGREPVLLGSLKAQDYLKAAVIIFAVLGLVANHADLDWITNLFRVTN